MTEKIKIGDVIEIQTAKGFAYAQYAIKEKGFGALLRVLPCFYKTRPSDFTKIILERERFVTYFPLQAAINKKIFTVVANCLIPEHAKKIPLFRAAGYVDRQGKVHNWFLHDGETSWRIEELTPEQAKLPIRAVWNDTLLVERVEKEWTSETDPRTIESMS